MGRLESLVKAAITSDDDEIEHDVAELSSDGAIEQPADPTEPCSRECPRNVSRPVYNRGQFEGSR